MDNADSYAAVDAWENMKEAAKEGQASGSPMMGTSSCPVCNCPYFDQRSQKTRELRVGDAVCLNGQPEVVMTIIEFETTGRRAVVQWHREKDVLTYPFPKECLRLVKE